MALPVLNTAKVNAKTLFLATRCWIEKSDPLNESAIARFAAIRNGKVVKWTLFSAASCQSDCNHNKFLFTSYTRHTHVRRGHH
jgi:hypothetical protein